VWALEPALVRESAWALGLEWMLGSALVLMLAMASVSLTVSELPSAAVSCWVAESVC